VTAWLRDHQTTLLSQGGLEALARAIDAALTTAREQKGGAPHVEH
jgi:hypothetical protein